MNSFGSFPQNIDSPKIQKRATNDDSSRYSNSSLSLTPGLYFPSKFRQKIAMLDEIN